MSKRILKKKYYKITFDLASPLALGSGDNENTDKDLMKDRKGNPFIPASSIAGVIKAGLKTKYKKLTEKYLGDLNPNTGNEDSLQEESSILFYDATITGGEKHISVRDSVKLDEFKTAVKGAKFDMEVLEPGVTFTTFVEQSFTEDYEYDFGIEIAREFLSCPVFGGKSTRGYGSIKNIVVKEKSFDLNNEANVNEWLAFDVFSEDVKWNECEMSGEDYSRRLAICLKQRGGISIRRYTTKVSTKDTSEPDMEQLTLKNGSPVIPGTSWAGALSHRMEEFGIKRNKKGSIFGFVDKDSKARSKVVFGETVLSGCSYKVLSRNAIDRFTGGTVDGALFTEKTYYGGKGELVIKWIDKEPIQKKERKALAAALTDLHYGFLAVGGETSIGRGLFSIESINGNPIPKPDVDNAESVFSIISSEIEEVFK